MCYVYVRMLCVCENVCVVCMCMCVLCGCISLQHKVPSLIVSYVNKFTSDLLGPGWGSGMWPSDTGIRFDESQESDLMKVRSQI